ncbi:MAG: ABC transporter ATP-binding protein [Spongiibacteraceae bacterium]
MKLEGSSAPIVTVTALNHHYASATAAALNNINLQIPAGSCFGLLGPNGAGKTTLISLLTGILSPQKNDQLLSASIQVAGFSFPNDAAKIKKISGLVPQDYAFYPALTGRENLTFFAGLYQIAAANLAARMDYCVRVCGLEKVLDKPAATYSGGIKRRLNIALGLLHDPKILYLDEPTVGIDAQSRHFILQAIEQLKASGMTIVYTSHYMEEVEQICDQLAIIDHGEVLLQASMASLLQDVSNVVITPAVALAADTLASLRQSFAIDWDGKNLTMQLVAGQSLSMLIAAVEQLGISVSQLHYGSNSLEQIYLRATHRELRQ